MLKSSTDSSFAERVSQLLAVSERAPERASHADGDLSFVCVCSAAFTLNNPLEWSLPASVDGRVTDQDTVCRVAYAVDDQTQFDCD